MEFKEKGKFKKCAKSGKYWI